MVNEGDIKNFLRASYFLFQKMQNYTWENVKKSSSLTEVQKEFALNYRIELSGKFRIIHYSFDNSRQRWMNKVILLVNTNYVNQSFIEIICETLDNVASQRHASENITQTAEANTTLSKSDIKKKRHRTLILVIALICFFSSFSVVGTFLYFNFPLVFQQVTEPIFNSFP
ncbi:MAG: hypothetical protein CMM43_07270 [Rhodospirillaceae bacterium]|nr:hypothetical protein [Rhodospirillaceae bacterium]|tara:strand:- start:1841 stop:2350 length:510 start_codon:yes stop_codon:yes gene_type:complete